MQCIFVYPIQRAELTIPSSQSHTVHLEATVLESVEYTHSTVRSNEKHYEKKMFRLSFGGCNDEMGVQKGKGNNIYLLL